MEAQDSRKNDFNLIHSIKSGDKVAYRAFVERFQATAFRFAFRLSCNTPDAQDIVQEAFIRVWHYRDKLRPEARFTTLLYTIVSRLWIDQQRKTKRRGFPQTLNNTHDQLADQAPSLESIAINRDLAERIERISHGLSPRQRLVFTLRDIEDLSIREVVDITGLSRSSVKTNLSLARANLRKQLCHLTGKLS